MRFEIVLAPEAIEDLRELRAVDRSAVVAGIEMHLRHEPTKQSKSRIKRLRGTKSPQYRLRIGDVRLFHDVAEHEVYVLAVVPKLHAGDWLRRHGTRGNQS